MAKFKTIDDLDVAGKRVLVRADLNVPAKDGVVTDSTRIDRFAPTARDLAAKGAKVIVCSHFGRPKGERVPDMSLKFLVEPLAAAVGKPIAWADDCIGPGSPRRWSTDWPTARSACSRTCATTRRRKERPRVLQEAGASGRHLRQRRLLHRPPRPMPRPKASPSCCPTPPDA